MNAPNESPLRIAAWWILETTFLFVCGGVLIMYLDLPDLVSAVLVVGLLWFALVHMHAALELEHLVLSGRQGPDLFAQRRQGRAKRQQRAELLLVLQRLHDRLRCLRPDQHVRN